MSTTEPKPFGWKTAFFIAVFAAAPAWIYGAVQIYDRVYQASGPELIATAINREFELPSELRSKMAGYAHSSLLIAQGKSGSELEKYPESPEYKKASDAISSTFSKEFGWIDESCLITIKNTDDLPADDVRIILNEGGPSALGGIAAVKRDDNKTANFEYVNDIRVDEIEAESSLRISVWPKHQMPSEIIVTHSGGKMAIPLNVRRSPFEISWLDLTTAVAPMVLIAVGATASMSFLSAWVDRMRRRRLQHLIRE